MCFIITDLKPLFSTFYTCVTPVQYQILFFFFSLLFLVPDTFLKHFFRLWSLQNASNKFLKAIILVNVYIKSFGRTLYQHLICFSFVFQPVLFPSPHNNKLIPVFFFLALFVLKSLFCLRLLSSFCFQEHEKRCWSVDFNLMDPKLLASGSDDAKGTI